MSNAARSSNYDWSDLVEDACLALGKLTGNVFEIKQRPMVESRMRRRLLELKLETPADYKVFWDNNFEQENKFLIGLLTTHFTSFFREFSHFEWIASQLPEIVAHAKSEGRKSLSFWSAACSKGQEVYSLCMWLQHHLPKIDPTFTWSVFGTDIDPESVKEAENGVYHRRELETSPRHLWEGYWSRGKGDIEDWYKIKSSLRSHASFSSMNLLNLTLPKNQKFDVIMCRNVLIYFDRKNQEKVATDLMKYLTPEGVLITGMSESLNGYGLPIKSLSASIYKSNTAKSFAATPSENVVSIKPKVVKESLPIPLKVFCIDDSSTVLTIIKKVLSGKEFEVIGVASNGQDAIDKLKTLNPDVITLDLHMPIMDGPTFLKNSGIASRIPVIVVSSVARDDEATVSPLFSLGVSDFVEKPTLANITQIGDELIQKLKMSWLNRKQKINSPQSQHEQSRKKRPSGHIVFNAGKDDFESLILVLDKQKWKDDYLTIILNKETKNSKEKLDKITSLVKESKKFNILESNESLNDDHKIQTIWVNFKSADFTIVKRSKGSNHLVISEESSALSSELKSISDDIAPATSISYNLDKLLGGE